MSRHGRGLTLIEMLLALVLLGAVTAAAATWTALAARASIEHAAPNAWKSAAEATLRLIYDDLASGDSGEPEEPEDDDQTTKQPQRVTVTDGMLTIRTREGGIGATLHAYRHDAIAHRLYVVSQDGRNSTSSRLLLDEVETFECVADAEHAGTVMQITIRRIPESPSGRGASAARRFELP